MKYALITGAAGGLAKTVIDSIVKDFQIIAIDKSDSLFACYKDQKEIRCFQCDITDVFALQNIKQTLLAENITLDLIINFAGIVMLGSVLEIPSERALNVLKVNLLGMYNVNQIFFDLMPDGGRIINLSSEYGRLDAIPFHSFYTMSKHAVEIYNDSLRRELNFRKIKVIKIRPGSFKTNMQSNISNQFDTLVKDTKFFKTTLLKMKGIMDCELEKAKDCQKIVACFKKAIYKKRPKLAYNVNNSFKMKLLSILPDKLQDKIFAFYFRNKDC